MRKIWQIKNSSDDLQKALSSALKISNVTAQLLVNRGITGPEEAQQFLTCSFSGTYDPFLLKDMDKAVLRVKRAIERKEKILVYGDYDVDGITSVAILYTALKNLGASADPYIPNRLEEGYGLNSGAIKKAERNGVSLIITVDCGITSFRETEYASSLNIDIIITDHHEIPGGEVPKAVAVINPLQKGCKYPFKHLAGVGVAYKLAKALYSGTPFEADDFLDLVSLGTVADIAPLVGENRILVKHGLDELNSRNRIGLKVLMDASGLIGKDISSGHIGFILGPRINAMGRVGSPHKALELLLSTDEAKASELAAILNSENRNRQKLEARILDEAIDKVEREVNFKEHKVIVLASENWHPGVIGIVASRITEKYYRPAILIAIDGDMAKGSGRSVENFHLFEYLLRSKDALVGFGGHESACGVTLKTEKIDEFRAMINAEAAKEMHDTVFTPKLDIDIDVPLNAINEDVINEIEKLAPFGAENPRPVLASRNLKVKDGPRSIGKKGFKMWVTDDRVTCEAITFGRSDFAVPEQGRGVDLAYIPSINTWQGLSSIQLELRDIVENG